MKTWIDKDGRICIKPENSTEDYALTKAVQENEVKTLIFCERKHYVLETSVDKAYKAD